MKVDEGGAPEETAAETYVVPSVPTDRNAATAGFKVLIDGSPPQKLAQKPKLDVDVGGGIGVPGGTVGAAYGGMPAPIAPLRKVTGWTTLEVKAVGNPDT